MSHRESTFTWDPGRYHRYGDLRLRPALELLGRIDHPGPRLVHDLGCGGGELSRLMADRWPEARVIGSDSSPEMLATAAATESRVEWTRLDVRSWDPPEPPDVVFANAVLHWVEGHDELLVRIVTSLRPGGIFAFQMPLSWGEPSHILMREILATGGLGGGLLGDAALRRHYDRRPVESPGWYYRRLAPHCSQVDVWTTRYYQVLSGDDPVLDWVEGTALRPILEALADDELTRFLDRYRAALGSAYPTDPSGATVFPFPRLFVVATR